MHGNGMRGRPTRRRHSLTPGGGGAARGGWLAGRNEDEKVVQTGHEGEKDPQKRASHPIRGMLRPAPPPRAIESPRRGRLWNGGSKHDGLEPRPPRPAPARHRSAPPTSAFPPAYAAGTRVLLGARAWIGRHVLYCILLPARPIRPLPLASDLLSRCRRLAVAARGLRGRQAHRTAQQYSIPSPWPMHPRRPKFPCRSFPLQLCFPVPSPRSLLFPSLAFGAQLLRAAPTPCNVPCLSTTVCCWYGRMVVVSTVDRSTTTILRTAVEW